MKSFRTVIYYAKNFVKKQWANEYIYEQIQVL